MVLTDRFAEGGCLPLDATPCELENKAPNRKCTVTRADERRLLGLFVKAVGQVPLSRCDKSEGRGPPNGAVRLGERLDNPKVTGYIGA